MGMPQFDHDWTVAERDALPDDGNRYEVIDGELLVTPAPSLAHQAAVLALASILAPYTRREGVGHAFVAPGDVVFSWRRGVQPDVFVIPLVNGRRPERFDKENGLLLAVEVLSPSTARADRVRKRTLYREEGVPEYWIVDMDARTFERSTPAEPRPEVIVERLEWMPAGASAPLVIDIVEFFVEVLDR
ncbi:MAG TPA: Uma2 family endonuclease [Gemmatimonadaceae bacterium]|nr:Uma2 family endonuclease [Gemmatimonadaceae bacterium]